MTNWEVDKMIQKDARILETPSIIVELWMMKVVSFFVKMQIEW